MIIKQIKRPQKKDANVESTTNCTGTTSSRKSNTIREQKKRVKTIFRKLKQYYLEEEKTTLELLKYISEETPDKGNVKTVEADINEAKKRKENKTFCGEKIPRSEAIDVLESRLLGLRGRRLSYREKLLKQGIMNRIKKKKKLELRKELNLAKKLNKARKVSQNTSNTTYPSNIENEFGKKIICAEESEQIEDNNNIDMVRKKVDKEENVGKSKCDLATIQNETNLEAQPITDLEGNIYTSKKEMKRALKIKRKADKKRLKRKEVKMQKQIKLETSVGNPDIIKDVCFPNKMKCQIEKNSVAKPINVHEIKFNNFEFKGGEEESKKKKVISDPKRALQMLQKTSSRIKHLQSTGREEKAQKVKEKVSWNSAIEKAEGIKVKDNVELIKKSIRRKDGMKKNRKKKWDERNEQLKQKMEGAQKKRKENIMAKKKQKKAKKKKILIKKGRIVP